MSTVSTKTIIANLQALIAFEKKKKEARNKRLAYDLELEQWALNRYKNK